MRRTEESGERKKKEENKGGQGHISTVMDKQSYKRGKWNKKK